MKNKTILLSIIFLLLPISIFGRNKIKVACVGNSITYGYGLKDRENESYPSILQKLLGSSYEVGNFGKSGATLLKKGHRPYIEQEEYKKALDFKADIVVIHLGINDTDPRNWPNYRDEFIPDYISLINDFKRVNNKTKIIIALMTPIRADHPRFNSGTRDWHKQIQEAIKIVANKSKSQLIDFYTPLKSHLDWFPDAIHPNKDGSQMLAKIVYQAITGDFGGLHLPDIYSDNMVFQRNTPITISGNDDAGKLITIKFNNKKYNTRSNKNGKWSVTLPAMPAGGQYKLEISDNKKSFCFRDITFGEVWLCSGQSNMEFMLKESNTGNIDIPNAKDSYLRLYNMKARWKTDDIQWNKSALDSIKNLHYYNNTKWEKCSPKTVADFSAVAYYFGKMLRDSLNVPIGLICNAVGGSPTESWIENEILEKNKYDLLRNWYSNDFVQPWVRERALKNLGGNKSYRHPYQPSYLFLSGIKPLKQFPIKGIIWYQGESNAHNCDTHSELFKMLVMSFRHVWKNPKLPIYYVQLSSLDRPSWTWFRDSQRKLMDKIDNIGMVVSSDKGDSLNVHPKDKIDIGNRLGFWALNKEYKFKNIQPSGPLVETAKIVGDNIIVSFKYVKNLKTKDNSPVKTFEIAGKDQIFIPIKANIKKDKIIIKYDSTNIKPIYIRYGWQPFTRANLYNESNLPASTFRIKIKTKANNSK